MCNLVMMARIVYTQKNRVIADQEHRRVRHPSIGNAFEHHKHSDDNMLNRSRLRTTDSGIKHQEPVVFIYKEYGYYVVHRAAVQNQGI